jgi:hypothetical protein
MSAVDVLLSRCHGVKQTGPNTWIACCTVHRSKSKTSRPLSIRVLEDGRILVKCWGGCPVEEVLGAIGLSFSDLYPDRAPSDHRRGRERRPFPAGDILQAVAHESLIVAICAADIGAGKSLSNADRERVMVAAARLQDAHEAARGRG